MPTYEYRCEANGQVLEVQHKMSERVLSWGELCARLGLQVGATPADAPVTKLISGSYVNSGSTAMSEARPCETGAPCCGGVCGISD